MTDPSSTVPPEVYLQAAAAANNFDSFGRGIASSVLRASAEPTHSINVTASAQPLPLTHGSSSTCVSVEVSIDGASHSVTICLSL
jgi:hypothetical protein